MIQQRELSQEGWQGPPLVRWISSSPWDWHSKQVLHPRLSYLLETWTGWTCFLLRSRWLQSPSCAWQEGRGREDFKPKQLRRSSENI